LLRHSHTQKLTPSSYPENLQDTINLLLTYSLAKPRNGGGIIIHRLVLRWAKERLDDTKRVQAARDTVLVIAQYNYNGMDLHNSKWITRDFAQKFVDWNMRCVRLIRDYLEDNVHHSSDWTLLLAVERLAMDFFYSEKADETIYLINTMMQNPRMSDRAYGMARIVAYYRTQGVFPPTRRLRFNSSHQPGPLSGDLDLIYLTTLAMNRTEFDAQKWEEWYESSPGLDKRFLTPRLLINITRLESMINKPAYHFDLGEQLRAEMVRIRDVTQEWSTQTQALFRAKILPPFNGKMQRSESYHYIDLSLTFTHPDRLVDLPQIMVQSLNHPLVTQMISKLPENLTAPAMSTLAIGFRLDYILTRYDTAFLAIWNQTLSLHKDHNLSSIEPSLKSILEEQRVLGILRCIVLSKDHPIYPKRHQFNLDITTEAYSTQMMIKKLESDFADVAITTNDLGPAAVALKTLLFTEIVILNVRLIKEQGGKASCVSQDLLLFAELLLFEQEKVPDVPKFGDDTEKRRTKKKLKSKSGNN
jgi:hypothetical protein